MRKLKFPAVGVAMAAALTTALLLARPVVHAQGGLVLSPAQVVGPNVTLSWTALAGATGYALQVGVTPGQYILNAPVGNTTTTSTTAPRLGTYYVRVVALVGGTTVASNEVAVQIVAMAVPPAAPTDLAAFINGRGLLLTWNIGAGGGVPTAQRLFAGTTPGGSELGAFPIAAGATQMGVPSVGAGTYYLRVVALNAGGASAPSNEVQLVMPAGGGCSVPPSRSFTTTGFGRYVQFSWAPVPGAAGYRMDFTQTPGGPIAYSQPLGPNQGRFAIPNAPFGTYYGRLTTAFSCGSTAQGPEVSFTVDGAPPPGPRAPNPAPGQRLPFPGFGRAIVEQLARERGDLLHASCREHGGNNRFMFEAVRRLRQVDNRFGLNWKRGGVGDLSQDIVNYNYSSDSDEGTRNVYIIDIIGGHCGSNPSANFQDQTGATRDAGTIGIWTLIPYLDSGYPLAMDPFQGQEQQ